MMNDEKQVDILVKYDLSMEEFFLLKLFYYKKYALLWKYSNYTPETNELRYNPNLRINGKEVKVGDRVKDYTPPYGLPTIKNALVVGNRARRSISKEDINSLLERGFLEVDMAHSLKDMSLDKFRIGDEFAKEFAFDIDAVIDELYEAYPKQTIINGKSVYLTGADRGSMSVLYANSIGRDYDLHREVLRLIAKNYDNLSLSINNFIASRLWVSMLQVEKEGTAKVDMSVDV